MKSALLVVAGLLLNVTLFAVNSVSVNVDEPETIEWWPQPEEEDDDGS